MHAAPGGHISAANRALNNVLPASIASACNLETLCLKELGMGAERQRRRLRGIAQHTQVQQMVILNS